MKIAFVGTMSVGKSTLVNALKKHSLFKDYKFFTERSKYLRDLGIPLDGQSTLNGQIIFMAERANELMNNKFIADRSVIDVMAFTNLSSKISHVEKLCFEDLSCYLIEQYDYIFYISPKNMPLENNGVRTVNVNYRNMLDEQIKKIIEYYRDETQVFEIEGMGVDERVEFVVNSIHH